MNTTLIEPTFESIAKSAKFITVKKTNHAPLPCEKGFEIKGDENIVRLTERFPVLDMSFMQQTYFDEEHKINMPVFAAVDVTSGKVDSGDRLFVAQRTIDSKLNPKLTNIITETQAKWPFFVIGGFLVLGATAGYFLSSYSTKSGAVFFLPFAGAALGVAVSMGIITASTGYGPSH